MNDKDQLKVLLKSVKILKARIKIAKMNDNQKELEQLHIEYDKWNNLIEKLSKDEPKMAYTLNEYYLNNKALEDIAIDLNTSYAVICNINANARYYLINTGLWEELL